MALICIAFHTCQSLPERKKMTALTSNFEKNLEVKKSPAPYQSYPSPIDEYKLKSWSVVRSDSLLVDQMVDSNLSALALRQTPILPAFSR